MVSRRATIKRVITCLLALPLACILIEATGGVTFGLIGGLRMRGDESLDQDIREIVGPTGESRATWSRLSPEKKKLLEARIRRVIQGIDWFGPTLFVSGFVFAIVGFGCGFITRSFYLVGLVPAATFLINNPVVRFAMARELSLDQKLIVVIFAQFGGCYLAAYGGTVLARRRAERRRTGDSVPKPQNEDAEGA